MYVAMQIINAALWIAIGAMIWARLDALEPLII